MGKLTDGIFGGFSGKVGNLVGYNIGGEDLVRTRPRRNPNRIPTDRQREQRDRFALVIKFITPMQEVVGSYFSRRSVGQSRVNLAVGYNLKNAVIDRGAGIYTMDYNKVLISKGELRGIEDGTVSAEANRVINLAWTDNSGQGSAAATDVLIVVAYSQTKELYQIYNPSPATRVDAQVQLTMPAYFSGDEVHVWATLVSADKKVAANSSYMGAVIVT